MENTEEPLTKAELQFIESCLNETWHASHQHLQKKDIGDLDRIQTQRRKDLAKEILNRVSKLAY